MIIIGSYAAELGGFLPDYRSGMVRDIDIVCSADELVALVEATDWTIKRHFADKYLVFDAPRVVEINVYPDHAVTAMEALCEVQSVALSREVIADCYVVTPEVIWATLVETLGCLPEVREKSTKDLEHYQSVVDARGMLTEEHHALAEFYKRRTTAQVASRG